MKEQVIIFLTDDDRGFYSIYNESGQSIEVDFESEDEAYEWAVDCDYEVVGSFNV